MKERCTKIEHFYQATPELEGTAKKLAQYAILLGTESANFARVCRAPRYLDGERESDAEHSFMLAMIAPELAHALELPLSTEKICQYAIVHDLIELETGDVPTFQLTPEQLQQKEQAEQVALKCLLERLPPYTAHYLAAYETQADAESRFVRAVDKLLPLVVDVIGDGVRVMSEDYGVTSHAALTEAHNTLHARIAQKFGDEFPDVILAHAILCELFETVYLTEISAEKIPEHTSETQEMDLSATPNTSEPSGTLRISFA